MNSSLKEEIILSDLKTTKTDVVYTKGLKYSDINLSDLLDDFSILTEKGKIVNSEYYDYTWELQSPYEDYHKRISFKSKRFRKEMKAYCVCLLKRFSVRTVDRCIKMIYKMLDATRDFTTLDFNAINVMPKSSHFNNSLIIMFLDFIDFDDGFIYELANKLNKCVKDYHDSCRDLPTVQSCLIFNSIINDMISNSFDGVRKYIPIVLWWKLTTVIPMRPSEFLTLKRYNFYKNKSDYYIHIDRIKSNDIEKPCIPLRKEYKINKEIFDLFDKYFESISFLEEGYIFNTIEKNGLKFNREYYGYANMNNLLIDFHVYISEKYNLEIVERSKECNVLKTGAIERMEYGDTRHYAMLNMIISGINPYEIAQMSGHTVLQSQMSYYGETTSFCMSKAYALYLGLSSDTGIKDYLGWNKKASKLGRERAEIKIRRKVDGGYCSDDLFPYRCPSGKCDDGSCEFFTPDSSEQLTENKETITSRIKKNNKLLRAMVLTEPFESSERAIISNTINEDVVRLARLIRNENQT